MLTNERERKKHHRLPRVVIPKDIRSDCNAEDRIDHERKHGFVLPAGARLKSSPASEKRSKCHAQNDRALTCKNLNEY